VAPGFSAANKETTVTLVRIMFLSPILFGLSNIFSGILQYFNRFLVYSIAPILYNWES
jgi:putative peptidoglycan lipid II flippase